MCDYSRPLLAAGTQPLPQDSQRHTCLLQSTLPSDIADPLLLEYTRCSLQDSLRRNGRRRCTASAGIANRSRRCCTEYPEEQESPHTFRPQRTDAWCIGLCYSRTEFLLQQHRYSAHTGPRHYRTDSDTRRYPPACKSRSDAQHTRPSSRTSCTRCSSRRDAQAAPRTDRWRYYTRCTRCLGTREPHTIHRLAHSLDTRDTLRPLACTRSRWWRSLKGCTESTYRIWQHLCICRPRRRTARTRYSRHCVEESTFRHRQDYTGSTSSTHRDCCLFCSRLCLDRTGCTRRRSETAR